MPQRSLFQPARRTGHPGAWAPDAAGSAMKPSHTPAGGTFRFIDLFAGIGGMRLGFESIGGHCVFTSEWDPFSRETYAANHACDHPIAGDIRQVATEDIPAHDVLLAGFPCQPFSIAGVSKKNALNRPHGFRCEVQGTLFFDIARIIRHHRPQAFLLENVRNLLSHDRGRTFAVIRETLEKDLGYQVDCRVIDARSYVPQHRERIFIAGFRDEVPFSFRDLAIPDSRNGPRLRTILHPGDGTEPAEPPYTVGEKATVSPKYILSDHLWTYLQGYAQKTPQQGQRVRLRARRTWRREPNSFRPLLQGRLRDSDSPERGWTAAAFDPAGVRPTHGIRPRWVSPFRDSRVRHAGLSPIRKCGRRSGGQSRCAPHGAVDTEGAERSEAACRLTLSIRRPAVG